MMYTASPWESLTSLRNPSLPPNSPQPCSVSKATTDLFLSLQVSLQFLEFYRMESSYNSPLFFGLAPFTQLDFEVYPCCWGYNSLFFSFLNSKTKYVKHSEWFLASNKRSVNGSCYPNNIKILLKFKLEILYKNPWAPTAKTKGAWATPFCLKKDV